MNSNTNLDVPATQQRDQRRSNAHPTTRRNLALHAPTRSRRDEATSFATSQPEPEARPGEYPVLFDATVSGGKTIIHHEPDVVSYSEALSDIIDVLLIEPKATKYLADVSLIDGSTRERQKIQLLGMSLWSMAQQVIYSHESITHVLGDYGQLVNGEIILPLSLSKSAHFLGEFKDGGSYHLHNNIDDTALHLMSVAHKVMNSPDLVTAQEYIKSYWLPRRTNDRFTKFVVAVAIIQMIEADGELREYIHYTPEYLVDKMIGSADTGFPRGWAEVQARIPRFNNINWIWRTIGNNYDDTVGAWHNARQSGTLVTELGLPASLVTAPNLLIGSWKTAFAADLALHTQFLTQYEQYFYTTRSSQFKSTPGYPAQISVVTRDLTANSTTLACHAQCDARSASLLAVLGLKTWFDPKITLHHRATSVADATSVFYSWIRRDYK